MKLVNKLLALATLGGVGSYIWLFFIAAPPSFVAATFIYSKGYSYFLDDPNACANCHVMEDHLYAYEKSSHHNVATCNSCHTPDGFLQKYTSKAINGWNHGLAFTTGNYPWPFQITEYNKKITRGACLKCHSGLVEHININSESDCIRCHSDVGHMR